MVGQCTFPDHEQKKQGQCEHQHRLFLKHAAARDVVHLEEHGGQLPFSNYGGQLRFSNYELVVGMDGHL